jgi:3-methyladenine DNA glycosylase AlkD
MTSPDRARDLGRSLGADVADATGFVAALRAALQALADPEVRDGQAFIAPGIGPTHGVRVPLQTALLRGFRASTRGASPADLLLICDRLLREPEREARWFAAATLERLVTIEPERAWQLLRRAAREADDWITVDTLAHPFGRGVLGEPYRWAELEQLTVSPSRWERRLVGSTIATIPFVDRRAGREPSVAARALPILAMLIGDREPDVQKALAWAYRSLTLVDPGAVEQALATEAARAVRDGDGQRAWVVRDALPKLPPAIAGELRGRLAGIRRRPGAPSTSVASELTSRFSGMGLGAPLPEPPLDLDLSLRR